jgi:hypothetical protein
MNLTLRILQAFREFPSGNYPLQNITLQSSRYIFIAAPITNNMLRKELERCVRVDLPRVFLTLKLLYSQKNKEQEYCENIPASSAILFDSSRSFG